MSKKLTIDWKPDKASGAFLVDQIVHYVITKVQKGDWLYGDVLPSQRTLANVFEVNRSTVVTALSELVAMGVLESKVGSGTAVANNTWSFLMNESTPDWSEYISQGFHKSNLPTIQIINEYEFKDSIIRLSTGEVSPDLMAHDAFSETLHDLADMRIPYNYLEPLGLYELRVELSTYLTSYGIKAKPSEILIVSGSLQALQLISLRLLGRHSTVYIGEYSYVKSLRVFEFAGVKMSGVPTDKNGPVPWLIDASSLADGTSILYTIPTFHNPTGRTMDMNRRKDLLEWCQRNRLPIIEDDAYRELYLNGPPPKPIKAIDETGNVLYMGSVSKSLAPGLRIGWVVGPEAVIERLGDIKMQTDYGASSVSQWMLTSMLRTGKYQAHLVQLREVLLERRNHVLKLLHQYMSDLATWNIPEGGFYIWVELQKDIRTDKLFEEALKENVLINPGSIYGFKRNRNIRISYSYASMEDMEAGIIILSKIIKNLALD